MRFAIEGDVIILERRRRLQVAKSGPELEFDDAVADGFEFAEGRGRRGSRVLSGAGAAGWAKVNEAAVWAAGDHVAGCTLANDVVLDAGLHGGGKGERDVGAIKMLK